MEEGNKYYKEYVSLIGEFFVEFSWFELFAVDFYITELIDARAGSPAEKQFIGNIALYEAPLGNKIEILRQLISRRFNKEKEFRSIFKKLTECVKLRNKYAHSRWSVGGGDRVSTISNKRDCFKKGCYSPGAGSIPHSKEEIEKDIKFIKNTLYEVSIFIVDCLNRKYTKSCLLK